MSSCRVTAFTAISRTCTEAACSIGSRLAPQASPSTSTSPRCLTDRTFMTAQWTRPFWGLNFSDPAGKLAGRVKFGYGRKEHDRRLPGRDTLSNTWQTWTWYRTSRSIPVSRSQYCGLSRMILSMPTYHITGPLPSLNLSALFHEKDRWQGQ